ncbi:hypothetical protein CHUAL_001803 [Chamberlinius hualienensis]
MVVRAFKSSIIRSSFVLAVLIHLQICKLLVEANTSLNFDPKVTASCTEFPYMKVNVLFDQPFYGVVHTKDHRSDACQVFGNGGRNVTLALNVMAERNAINDCGVQSADGSGEKSVSVYVRYHRTLERLEDKIFSISCNNPGFLNSRNEISRIAMSFVGDNQKTEEVVQGRQYILRVDQSQPDDQHQLKIKKCYSFSTSTEDRVDLTDDRGCPLDSNIMSVFKYNEENGSTEAIIFSMFKFPNSLVVSVNCLVAVCQKPCIQEVCGAGSKIPSLQQDNIPYQFWTALSAHLVAPTEPNAEPMVECSIQRWSWLLGLCVAFGILFLIMLIVNILLCSALTCSCAKQEVVERDGSVIEDYDPYKTSNGGWGSTAGSQYGSRYSLNGKHDYPMGGGSTLNSTARSFTGSDHYAIVHNHPSLGRYPQGDDTRSHKSGYHQSELSAGRM